MWAQRTTDAYERDAKRYDKKHPRELAAVHENLRQYFESLQSGIHPMQVKAGYLHPEPQGVVAIDQKGRGKSLAETRLYVFPDVDSETLFLIALGDKRSQKDDIQTCRVFMNELSKQKESRDEDQQETV